MRKLALVGSGMAFVLTITVQAQQKDSVRRMGTSTSPALAPISQSGTDPVKRMGTSVKTPSLVAAPELPNLPPLSQAFFGVTLGEDVMKVAGRCRQAGFAMADAPFTAYTGTEYREIPVARKFIFEGALNGNRAIKSTTLTTYKGRVRTITVTFADISNSNQEAVRKALEEKYTKGPAYRTYVTTIDGRNVTISASFPSVTYSYDGIDLLLKADVDKLQETTTRQKAGNIEGDL